MFLGKKGAWGMLREHEAMYRRRGWTESQIKRHFQSYIRKFKRDSQKALKKEIQRWKKAHGLK